METQKTDAEKLREAIQKELDDGRKHLERIEKENAENQRKAGEELKKK